MEPPNQDQSTPHVRVLTAPGPGGVAVLRTAGPAAAVRLREGLGKGLPAVGEVVYGALSFAGAKLDEVLVVHRGKDVYEVHLHGSPAIVEEALFHLAPHAGSPAGGDAAPLLEATSMETKALAFAGRCASAWGARLAIDQSRGHLRRALEAVLELSSAERAEACRVLAERGRRAARLFTPTVVALVGPVNAGKSTLFNALMGRDEAVVSKAPGTTRDALSGYGALGGWPMLFVDTAGERELPVGELGPARALGGAQGGGAQEIDTQARIEAEGMGLARRAAARADVVLEVRPADSGKAGTAQQGAVDPVLVAISAPVSALVSAPGGPAPATVPIYSRADEALGSDPAAWPPGFLGAQPEPDHARRVIARAWAEALGLDPSAARFAKGLMGRGVPLNLGLIARLEALAADPGAASLHPSDLGLVPG